MKPTLKTSFTSYKPVALINGPFFHHLDHLAPLCHFLNCPLIVDDKESYVLGLKYYPEIDLHLATIDLRELSTHFNMIILSTKYAKEELAKAYEAMNIHHMRFCFCPHGWSDKNPHQENQDLILFYGERQKNLTQSKGNYLIVGNFRLAYYKKFQSYLDSLIENELSSFPNQKTILYAPTWNDQETATTFFQSWRALIDLVPNNYNLIIKLHPLLEKHHPAHAYSALSFDLSKPGLRVLFEMPLIYPLLNRSDIYLGDYSAIGYDFLYFNRPLFFLGSKTVPLHNCGHKVTSVEEFFQNLSNEQLTLKEKRAQEYLYTFSPFQI